MEPTPEAIAHHFPGITATLDPTGVEAFASALVLERVKPGEELVVQGSPHPTLYLLWEGRFVVALREDSSPADLGTLPRYSIVGEVSFLDGGPASATVTAVSRGAALILTAAALERLAAARPDVASALYHAIAENLAARLRVATLRFDELGAVEPTVEEPTLKIPIDRRSILDVFGMLFGSGRHRRGAREDDEAHEKESKRGPK